MSKDNVENSNSAVWNDSHSQGKIKILNPKDFIIPDFLKILQKNFGLDTNTLGITDAEEINKRLETMRFLFNQPTRYKLKEFSDFFSKHSYLPVNENEFLNQFDNNKSSFWTGIEKLLDFLRPYENVRSVKAIIEKIESRQYLQEKEVLFFNSIVEKLKKMAFLEGVVRMQFNYRSYGFYGDKHELTSEIVDSVVVGKKEYNATWGAGFSVNLPKWLKNEVFKVFRITKLIQKIADSISTSYANKSSVVTHLPYCIVNDIEKVFLEDYYDVMSKYYNCVFTIRFLYTDKGLELEIVDVENREEYSKFKFQKMDFSGFSFLEKMRFAKQTKKITGFYRRSSAIKNLKPIYDDLEKNYHFFSKKILIKSENTDEEFRWYALQNLYEDNKELTEKLREIRSFANRSLKEFEKLSNIVAYMQKTAEDRNLNICIPEIVETHKGTTFQDLTPIEIFGKEHNLIPFTLPTINGHILCLTGRHGGGKSVAGKSILSSIYLAQSGLPVFAKEFKTELKTVMGSVVNDEGEGSTATVFVEKIKNLLKGIGEVPAGESIIFIDEVGKGTQETAGINLGKRILKTIKDKKYSAVFNSQILQLAEYAQEELGAKCFVVDKNHKFKEGIGDGQMEELLKEKGLDQYLS